MRHLHLMNLRILHEQELSLLNKLNQIKDTRSTVA